MCARRKKLSGRIFLRGKTWYGRFRSNGKETTFCTGIRETDGIEGGLAPRQRAEAILQERTEILRLRSKIVQMAALRSMIESTEEQIDRRIEEMRKVTLASVPSIFEKSKMRIDCSAERMIRYKGYVERLISKLGNDTDVRDVDNAIADSYATDLDKSFSGNTFNKHINGLSQVWRTLIRIGVAVRNPWNDINRRKLDTHTRRILTREETDKILAVAEGEMKVLIALGLYTGQRLGDLCQLVWDDVHEDRIDTRTRKTGARVIAPILPQLKKFLPRRGTGFILPGIARRYISSPSEISLAIIELFNKCGIETSTKEDKGRRSRPDCTFHSLRHTFASRAIEAGIPLTFLQAMLGHTTPKMTEHYTHIGDDAIIKAFEAL